MTATRYEPVDDIVPELVNDLCENQHTAYLLSRRGKTKSKDGAEYLGQFAADLNTLRSLMSTRKPPDFNQRTAHYFRIAFPFDQLRATIRKHPLPDPSQSDIVLSKYWQLAHQLIAAVHSLVTLKRLLGPPKTWEREQDIFHREETYAQAVENDPAFRKLMLYFRAARRDVFDEWYWAANVTVDSRTLWTNAINNSRPPQYRDYEESPRDPDWEYQLLPGEYGLHDGPLPPEHQLAITNICSKYCLRAFSPTRVLPQIFDLRVQARSLLVIVPNYLKLDWARHLPTDVINIVQERGDPKYPHVRPALYSDMVTAREHFDNWRLFVLCVVMAAHADMKVADLFELFCKHQSLGYPFTHAPDVAERNVVAQRMLKHLIKSHVLPILADALRSTDATRTLVERFLRFNRSIAIPNDLTSGGSLFAALKSAPAVYFTKKPGAIWSTLLAIRQLQ